MNQINQIHRCNICGNVVEILRGGVGQLVCCGQSMELVKEKTREEGLEKHVPVVEELPANVCHGKDGFVVRVGEIEHPMEEEHYIEWIEIVPADGKRGKKFLKPGEKPEVEFYTRKDIKTVRAYCNIHGLWAKRN